MSIRADKQKYVEELAMIAPSSIQEDLRRIGTTDRLERHLINIPKEGDLSKCEKYTSITLLSVPRKFFNRVLLDRMKDSVDVRLRDQQAGFRKDRSCTEQIATLRIIAEQSVKWNSSLYIDVLDHEKAFGSMHR
ncbi:unnamed protein product [Schistosoma mattheei]|uniref:Uncharacterized protein n=1 Tax=Schistosoma mattheei TaxID=31246 RepID=A0A183NGX8_9TREM|nr:unnamed protein product [Schistosoma mattheei]